MLSTESNAARAAWVSRARPGLSASVSAFGDRVYQLARQCNRARNRVRNRVGIGADDSSRVPCQPNR